jgi:hypothetical protein
VNDADSKLLNLLKATSEPGGEPELVKETEWSYRYKTGESYCIVSKFLADDTFAVSSSEMRKRWPIMTEDERLDFVQNFSAKPTWNSNDTEILMNDGNDRIWEHSALAFLKHPDRDRAVSFLVDRLTHQTDDEPLNYIQALGISKDRRAISAIKPYYEKYRKAVEADSTGIPDDVFFGPIPYLAYFVACGALLKIDGSPEYDEGIRKYLDHPHRQVRWWAAHELEPDLPDPLLLA